MSKKLYEKMNLYLANQEVAYIKLHNLHWYVKGRSFFTLHAKLEELYDRTAEIIDAVAERLLAVGQAPVANRKRLWRWRRSRNWQISRFLRKKLCRG